MLNNKKLSLTLNRPFNYVYKGLLSAQREIIKLEPLKTMAKSINFLFFKQKLPLLSG